MFHKLDVRMLPNPILIVSPHPDDDILSSGGLIQRALHSGKTIFVLYLTNGDGNGSAVRHFLHLPLSSASFIQLGCVRHQEAINAERFLGMPSSHLFFLSFPDTITLKIATNPNPNAIVSSPHTHFTAASYPFAFRVEAPYTRASEFRLVREVIHKVKPGTIILNRPEDTNPDHRAARLLALAAIRQSKLRPLVLSYLIHFPHWPTKGKFLPPAQLRKGIIFQFTLTGQELLRTHCAFELHASENKTSRLDRSLIHQEEFFWLGSMPIR
jgi:LmbE family N-acetylglucosaminyl deacetylase